jgi:predicted nucleic acid-binding protein
MNGIADTGFIVAFLNRRDRFHDWAVAVANDIQTPLITCEAVLAEAAFHLSSVEHVLALIDLGLIQPDFDVTAALPRLHALTRRYSDRDPDLADLCLIVLSERLPSHKVVTIDGDFRVYRRLQREMIPTLMPTNM